MEVTGYRIKIGEVEVIVTRTQLIELQAQIQQLIGPMPMPALPQARNRDLTDTYWLPAFAEKYPRALTPEEIYHLSRSRDAKVDSEKPVELIGTITTTEELTDHLLRQASCHVGNVQQGKTIDRELWEFAKTCKIPAEYFEDGPDDEPLW